MKDRRLQDVRFLDYHDVLLRQGDVALLEGPNWLNDQVVAFYFEYLTREVVVGPALPGSVQPGVLLLPPSTSFLLMHSGADLAREILAPLRPELRDLVLFAVNDNENVQQAAGGSHWSLLVFHRPSDTFRHYDSSPAAAAAAAVASSGGGGYGGGRARYGGNGAAARQLAAAVGPALASSSGSASNSGSGCGPGSGSGSGSVSGSGSAAPPAFVEVDSMPRQSNGYDCGVYVLAVARAACGWWLREQQGRQGEHAGTEVELEAEAPVTTGAVADSLKGAGTGTGADSDAAAVASWEREERGMGSWLTPGYVRQLRGEVGALIRGKAAEAAAVGAGAGVGPGVA